LCAPARSNQEAGKLDPSLASLKACYGESLLEVPPEQLYTEGPLAHEFPRTVSRLNEMQSAEFLALERRTVDTRIT
jgi:hypothetical protein